MLDLGLVQNPVRLHTLIFIHPVYLSVYRICAIFLNENKIVQKYKNNTTINTKDKNVTESFTDAAEDLRKLK